MVRASDIRIRELVDEMLYREPSDDRDTVYVTDCVDCPMKSVLKRRNGHRVTREMLYGTVMHDVIVSRIAEKVGGETEVPVSVRVVHEDGQFTLSGRADLVRGDTVYEFKFTEKPVDRRYLLQANAYAVLLGLPRYCIVAVTSRKTYLYCRDVDEEMYGELIENAIKVHKLLNNVKVNFSHGDCRKCEYKNVCPVHRQSRLL